MKDYQRLGSTARGARARVVTIMVHNVSPFIPTEFWSPERGMAQDAMRDALADPLMDYPKPEVF